MQHTNNSFNKGPAPGTTRQNIFLEYRVLQQEASKLKTMIATEQARCFHQHENIMHLQQQLEQTAIRCQQQKTLKEMYINREKETRRKLETLMKNSDEKGLRAARIASLARQTARRKKKKDLQADFEELQVAYTVSQEKFTADLQAQVDNRDHLRKQLETLQASHQQEQLRYDDELRSVRQQVASLQHELDTQIQQNDALLQHYWELQALVQPSDMTIAAEMKLEREKNNSLQEELDWVKVSLHETAEEKEIPQHICERERLPQRELEDLPFKLDQQLSLNIELSTGFEAERQDGPARELVRPKDMIEDKPLLDLPAAEQQEMAADPTSPATRPFMAGKFPNAQLSIFILFLLCL